MQKQIFEQEIRPFLLSRGLLCTSPMGSSFVKEVHQMNHKINHKFPRYVTCKSLMKLLVTRSRKQWRPILEYLADERVIVLLDWINELSLLEVHFFDHGLLLAPQSGEPHDAVVCKVETDACYHKPEKSADKKKQQKLKKHSKTAAVPVTEISAPENEEQTSDPPLGKATVASVLWESISSCTKLLEIQIVKGLYCKDSEHAEGVGLFLAVERPKELGIRKLDVVTDNDANCNIMMGKRDVYKSKSPETCMAFIQAAKDYDICKCRREPREMISHVNDLAKEAHSTKIELMDLRDIIERKSPQFWGMPFVRIKQDDGGIKTLLGGSEVSDTPSFTTRNYYIEVRNNSQKIDIFEGLLSDLDPEFVIVFASDVSAAEVVATLEGLRPCSIWESGAMVTRCSTSDHRAYVLVNHNGCIPAFTGSKCLIVAYDSPPDSIQYDNNQDSSGVMSVEFVEPGSKPHLHPDTAKEVDPFLSGFFHHPAQRNGGTQTGSNA